MSSRGLWFHLRILCMPLLEQLKQNLLWMISNGSRTGCCTHLSLYSSSPLLRYSNGFLSGLMQSCSSIAAAQRYIEQNGSKAFENLVNKFKSSNPRRSILEEVEVERRARIQLESEAREVNPFFNPEYQY
ncbi:HVA22-like protein a [Zea mays]|uniref:HVA22-like protein a n=1 Tax=Zea mays TaxID=4577 RepID=A0A1D6HKF3_MAIZE|nr:HVA22-like protein a [Zea mays]